MEVLKQTAPVAKKEHTCDWCLCKIEKGKKYENDTIKYDGKIASWKNHFHCREIANELDMFDGCEEGVGSDDFMYNIHELITCEFMPNENNDVELERISNLENYEIIKMACEKLKIEMD
jgi:hypothetical protein